MQMSIFDQLYPSFKITKPLKLIELFSGYGSQALALEYLGVNFEHFRICEWAVPSIEAYNDIHIQDFNDYSKDKPLNEVIDYLADKGISMDYNKPMNRDAISRRGEEWIRRVYNNVQATKDTVDIMRTHGSDFFMRERERVQVMMTYSFPCQDLSLAGKLNGMSEDSGTRSSMIWQVGRILQEMKDMKQQPDILLMENVPQVCGEGNLENFGKWIHLLEKLGYSSYTKILSATGFDIPQTRLRCFVISVPKGYSYAFPEEHKLNYCLNDFLEKDVDEKYFLSDEAIAKITAWNAQQKPLEQPSMNPKNVCQTITAKSNTLMSASMLLTRVTEGIPIKEATKKGFAMANDGNGVYIQNIKGKRGMVQKGKIQTIKTSPQDIGVVKIKCSRDKGYMEAKEGDSIGITFAQSGNTHTPVKEGISRTITTMCDHDIGVVVKKKTTLYNYDDSENFMKSKSRFTQTETLPVLLTRGSHHRIVEDENPYRIRKLTPKECWRLMGVKDEDFDKVEPYITDKFLYHLAGDSIVVNVLMAIFKRLYE